MKIKLKNEHLKCPFAGFGINMLMKKGNKKIQRHSKTLGGMLNPSCSPYALSPDALSPRALSSRALNHNSHGKIQHYN